MKKYLIICFVLCVAILSGCNSAKPGVNGPTPNQVTYLGENHKTQTLKIIDGAEGGNLILAGTDNSNLYTLDVTKVEVTTMEDMFNHDKKFRTYIKCTKCEVCRHIANKVRASKNEQT